MSHFAVCVITNVDPTEQVLKEALAPFHEFECTGWDNQYVQDIDKTEEIKQEYADATTSVIRLPDGTVFNSWDERFWRNANPAEHNLLKEADEKNKRDELPENLRRFRANGYGDSRVYRVLQLPEGAVWDENGKTSEIETMVEFLDGNYGYKTVLPGMSIDLSGEHKYGYALLDADGQITKIVDRTNPNKKWDWYVVGGRYRGRLLLKEGIALKNAGSVDSGLSSYESVHGRDTDRDAGVDSARVGDIDFAKMLAKKRDLYASTWDKHEAAYNAKAVKPMINGVPMTFAEAVVQMHKNWDLCKSAAEGQKRNLWDIMKADAEMNAVYEAVKDFTHSFMNMTIPAGCSSKEEYVNTAYGLTAWTVLTADGQWCENGEMGWWGISSGETMTEEEWHKKTSEMLAALPEDHFITIVDCHI